jgi:CBS domain-containing protein
MSSFQVPVKLYMSTGVVSVAPSDSLDKAYRTMSDQAISSLAVTDGDQLVGIISRSDLLRVGKRESGSSVRSPVLTFPARSVADEMTDQVQRISPDDLLSRAAGLMREHSIHRVFVVEGGRPVGVISTRDLLRALEEKQGNHSIGEYMTSPVFTIRDEETLGEAVTRLERGHASGLIVVENDWPVGVFGKAEALDARDLPRSVAVGDVMNPRILVLPSTTSLHRAAAQARALGVRRVVIHDGKGIAGIVSGLDFAKAVA